MRLRRKVTVKLVVIGLALGAALVRLPAAWVERVYSAGVYLRLQPVLTSASNQVPFALFDFLLASVGLLILVIWVRGLRQSIRLRTLAPVGRTALDLGALGAVIYLAFFALWGLNYQRQPLSARLALDAAEPRPQDLERLGATAVKQLNALYAPARDRGFADWAELPAALGPAFRATHQYIVPESRAVPAMPKRSLLTYYFERSGISGMTDPFVLEILVDRHMLPFERPFVTAHEWAHLAGYGDEAEANYLAWITCLNADPPSAYSGWLYLFSEVAAALGTEDRRALFRHLAPGPRDDLRAIAERARLVRPVVQKLSREVYDRYLKANRVEAGVASYSRSLRLVLATRFADGGKPALRRR